LLNPGSAISREEMIGGAQTAKALKRTRRKPLHGFAVTFQERIHVAPECSG
jgi:hypothetical protein